MGEVMVTDPTAIRYCAELDESTMSSDSTFGISVS